MKSYFRYGKIRLNEINHFSEKNQGGDTMKKKRMMTALLTTAMVFGAVPTAFAADNITVTVDGQKVSFGDQQPVNINGRVMVPVRAVAEKMGWDVEWFTYYGNTVVDGQFQQEHDIVLKNIVKKSDTYWAGYQANINIEHQTKSSRIDGKTPYQTKETAVTVPIATINGRTLLSIRDIAECTYSDIKWDSASQTVQITTKPVEQFPKYSDVLEYANIREGDTKRLQTESEETNLKNNKNQQEQQKQEEAAVKDESSYADAVIRLINEERKKAGLNPLEKNEKMMSAAAVRAEEINEVFGHTRPNGKACRTVLEELGYEGDYAGENIAGGQKTPEKAVQAWLNSEGHRNNALNPNAKYTGVGFLHKVNGSYTYYNWVQIFAR
jgi:uncharacterized protein YkwD